MRRPVLLISLFALFLTACKDPNCRPNEVKIGKTCEELGSALADASVSPSTGADGGASDPVGALADAGRSEVDAGTVAAFDAGTDASGEPDVSSPPADAAADAPEDGGAPPPPDAGGPSTPVATCLTDADGDGFGVEPATAACPSSGMPKSGDCNDGAASAYPGGKEMCGDGLDNDCNGKVDDGSPEQCNGIDDDCNSATPDGLGACGTFQCKAAKCLTSCSTDGDCVNGLHCVSGMCEGTQDGAACNADAQCSSGSCTVANKCGAKVAVNGGCNSAGDCPAGASCTTAGVCKLNAQSSCTVDADCASQACYGTCLAAKNGLNGACDSAADCSSDLSCSAGACKRAQGAACAANTDCGSGVCVQSRCVGGKQVLKQPCDEGADCDAALACVGNICRSHDGASCGADDECQHAACLPAQPGISAGCGSPLAFGSPCNSNPDCANGMVCSGTPQTCHLGLRQVCKGDAECGEGTCAPDTTFWDLKCRLPGGFSSLCDNDVDCATGTRTQCSKVGRCLLIPDEPCNGDPLVCASQDCEVDFDGLCGG